MERDQRRHQQPVGGRRPVGSPLVLVCLLVAIAVTLWGLGVARQQRPGATADLGSGSAAVSQAEGAQDSSGQNAAVTAQTFLQALDERAASATEPSTDNAIAVRLAWSEDRPMTEAAADLLRATARCLRPNSP